MATSDEIAQAVVVVCLNQPNFIDTKLVPHDFKRGNAELIGKTVGDFYQAIYKAVREAPSKTAEASKS